MAECVKVTSENCAAKSSKDLSTNLSVRSRQPGQELGAEVLGHEPVAAAESRGARRARRPGLHRQRGEVQTRGPTFRPLRHLRQLARGELDAGSFQHQLGLTHVEPEIPHADLLH